MPRWYRAVPAPRPAVLLLALATACGGPGSGSPEPRALAYGVPTLDPVVYAFADTAAFTIDGGVMGARHVTTSRSGEAELRFVADSTGLQAAVRFPRLRASFRSQDQGEVAVDESAVGGPFRVALTPRGDVEVVDTPALDPALEPIAGPVTLVRPLFVPLPGRPVRAGDQWVDTVRVVEDRGGMRSVSRSIVTSTLLGDTAVAGRRLLRIGTRAESVLETTGESGGVPLEQRIRGVITGRVLWDPERRLLVERTESGSVEGALSLPGMEGAAVPVRGRVRRSVSLRR